MKIVFVGDSITDVGRNTNNGSLISIGQGYALMVAGRLGLKYPKEFSYNLIYVQQLLHLTYFFNIPQLFS